MKIFIDNYLKKVETDPHDHEEKCLVNKNKHDLILTDSS